MIEEWISLVGENVYWQATVIVVVSVVAALIADWILTVLVTRWTEKTKNELDDRLLSLIHKPLFVSIAVLGLILATGRLPLNEAALWLTLGVLKTIAIVVWLVCAIRFSRLLLEVLASHQERFPIIQPRTLPLFYNLAVLVGIGASIYFVFLAWDIDVTAWLASAGIIGIAVSFAAKDTLANLFAGVFILADAPYKLGDFIVLDSGERGRVTQIGIRSTRLLTRDDVEITIPNAVMGTTKIVNESGGPYEKERVRVAASVAYGSDIDRVRDVLMEIALAHHGIATDPEPRVRFRRFGESGLEIELLGWIDEPVLRGRTIDALNTEIYKRFLEVGIEIPFPKRDLYIKEMPPFRPEE